MTQSKADTPKDKKPRVAVTGASGLVGSYLVEYLAKKDFPVTAIVRSSNQPPHLLALARELPLFVKIVIADVTELEPLKQAFDRVEVVVHAAGNVNPFGSREEIFATNVNGTKTALIAAKHQKVQQFIHVSSLSVITGQGDQYSLTEDAPLQPCGENYADSKVEAEKSVMAEAESPAIKVTVVRPGFIYGPHERSWMPRLIESIKGGKAALIDGGKKETNVVYVENLCQAIEAAILWPISYGQVYNITDGEKITKKDLFDAIADGLDLPRVTKVVPSFIARPFCEIVSRIASHLPVENQKKLARYSRAAYRLVGVNQGFSIAKAERQLRYVNRIPFAVGMAQTLKSFKSSSSPSSSSVSPSSSSGSPSSSSGSPSTNDQNIAQESGAKVK
jgi:2-alkyl-3-oxoalkanoate reductase